MKKPEKPFPSWDLPSLSEETTKGWWTNVDRKGLVERKLHPSLRTGMQRRHLSGIKVMVVTVMTACLSYPIPANISVTNKGVVFSTAGIKTKIGIELATPPRGSWQKQRPWLEAKEEHKDASYVLVSVSHWAPLTYGTGRMRLTATLYSNNQGSKRPSYLSLWWKWFVVAQFHLLISQRSPEPFNSIPHSHTAPLFLATMIL